MRSILVMLKTVVLLLIPAIALALTAQNRGNYSSFDTSEDLLLVQYDSLPDPDDVHCHAALGCMLLNPDLKNVDTYAVLGTTGTQELEQGFIDTTPLMNINHSPQGKDTWTNAWDGHLARGANWNRSVRRIKNKVKSIIQNGGVVFVAEAGQSSINADRIEALINEDVSSSLIKSNVVVVQHSVWNEAAKPYEIEADRSLWIRVGLGLATPQYPVGSIFLIW
ncbi:MAG: hypothetical protein AAGA18_08980 [Verrucomicrobiota bacterium]